MALRHEGGLGHLVRPNSDTSQAHANSVQRNGDLALHMGLKFVLKTRQSQGNPLAHYSVTICMKTQLLIKSGFPSLLVLLLL